MLSKIQLKIDFEKCLILVLVAGSAIHPASAACGLLIILSHQIAHQYFTRNISDKDRQAIQALKADVEKISVQQQKDGLAKAFGGQR